MSNSGEWTLSSSLYHGGLNQVYTTRVAWINGGKPYTVDWGYSGSFTETMSRSGYRTPGYYYLKKAGAYVPPTRASLDMFRGNRMNVALHNVTAGGWDHVDGVAWDTSVEGQFGQSRWFQFGASQLMTETNTLNRLQQKAQTRFFENSKNTSNFDGLVFAGELGETIRMISHRSSALADGIVDAYSPSKLSKTSWYEPLKQFFHNGTNSTKKSVGQLVSEKSQYWLENCYGWQPLVNDIRNGAEALADHFSDSSRRRFSSKVSLGKTRHEDTFTTSGYGINMGASFSGGKYTLVRKEKYEYRYGARQSMASAMRSSELSDFARFINVDGRSVLPAAWELLPYSFVVDSFTNVGDMIGALCTDTSNLYGGWLVAVREISVEKTFTFNCGSTSPQKYRSVTFLRAPWVISYNPSLTFHLPSAGGAANLAALALSKVRSLSNIVSAFS